MKTLYLQRKKLQIKEVVKHTALESDYKTLIDEPCIIVDKDDNQVRIIYDQIDMDTTSIVDALKKIKYHEGKRMRGLISRSRIFGYRPRSEIRGDYCSTTSLAVEAPTEHALVAELAKKLEEHYQKYNPKMYEKHKGVVDEKVKSIYRMNGTGVFTSGIINKNNPLKYHFDTGNFNDVYSCMIVFKHDVEGGYLSVPEYGIGFKLPNNSIFLFDGQSILHGVTPIKFQGEHSYRFSIVYYSLKRMWQCLGLDDELKRVRRRKTERERVRMNEPMTESDRQKKVANVASLKKRWGKQ